MNEEKNKKYWMTANNNVWIVMLVISFFVFFPAFIAFLVLWAIGRIHVSS